MRNLYLGLVTLFLTISLCPSRAAVVLNEMMPCNVSTVMNETGNFTGWVEVHNNGTESVNIRGYIFENVFPHADNPAKYDTVRWVVPGDLNVSEKGYKLIYFDENMIETSTATHASFKMETGKGGKLILYDKNKKEINRFEYDNEMVAHVSWGIAGGEEGYMMIPTPNAANEPVSTVFRRVAKPTFGKAPGFNSDGKPYEGSITVSLNCADSGAEIYYTTDGAEPTKSSTKYSEPITLSKTTVIRARAYMSNRILSDIVAGTYIFNMDSKEKEYHSSCGGFSVPVVSISTASDNFFGDKDGIYVVGTNGITTKDCHNLNRAPANYMQDWKRPIHFEYIVNGKQVVSQELDAAVMGGCSRQYKQKSLKITASNKLGNNKIAGIDGLFYDFFPGKKTEKDYKGLTLRNGGNDYQGSRTRDVFMQSLIPGRMNVDHQYHQPVAFYINGEYWGHMTLTERHNKDFVYTNYGLKDEDIDVIEISADAVDATEGDLDAYEKMMAEARINPASADYYDRMNRYIDIDEYIDYQIFEQFIGNTDWPGNNMKLWRDKNGGRFRWIAIDTDFGFGLYGPGPDNYCDVNLNMIKWTMGTGSEKNWANSQERMVELFKNLMNNEKFSQRFLNRYILHLGTTFVPERVIDILEQVRNGAEVEICAHSKKFSTYPSSNSMSGFANQRPDIVYRHLQEHYGLGSSVDLTISTTTPGADFIINGERVNATEYNGKYFKDMDLSVQPVAPVGYKFVSWNQSSVIKMLDSTSDWQYYYKGDQPEGDWTAGTYDDTAWDTGKGKFGYANDPGSYNTVLDYGENSGEKYMTAYFRTSFDVDNIQAIGALQAKVIFDDGFVLYVNGKEAYRSVNMPASPEAILYDTKAELLENDAQVGFSIDKSLLVKGKNVIAVEVHQNEASSSDLTFKFNLDVNSNGSGSSANQTYSTKVTDNMNLVATFEKINYVKPTLLINELCASNGAKSEFHDGYGTYGDWIEIYNSGDVAVDMGGMYMEIVKKNNEKTTYQFPTYNPFETTVPAKGYKIVWASKQLAQGSMHTNFKLTKGEAGTLTLYEMEGSTKHIIDEVSYTKDFGTKNDSYGRVTDGSSEWAVFAFCEDEDKYLATPERANGSELCTPQVSVGEHFAGTSVAMKLYPNPVKSLLNVTVNTADTYSLQVYDNQGRMIESIPYVNSGVVELDVQQYATGVYIIRAVTNDAVLQQKFIKY